MSYINPSGGIKQDELEVRSLDNENFEIYESTQVAPWNKKVRKEKLQANEFKIRFFSHACAEFTLGTKRLFTDPWLTGPAFSRGWWLVHQPPEDWLHQLSSADAIYISHNHSDHLNIPTLKLLVTKKKDIAIYIPAYNSRSCTALLSNLGFINIIVTPFDTWIPFGKKGRFMIFQDDTERDDSGILIEYKGHRILNTVDCSNICGGRLPKVDVLMTTFAGGTSGYPVCWGELYSTEHIRSTIIRNRKTLLKMLLRRVEESQPKYFIPFAGYFTEAHPADADIKTLNFKHTPAQVCELVEKHFKDTVGWAPDSGGCLDIGTGTTEPGHKQSKRSDFEFDTYIGDIQKSLSFLPLSSMDGIQHYFEWAAYKGDVLLHVIETGEDFKSTIREFFVDFSDLSIHKTRPVTNLPYTRMRVRSDVFRYVLKKGLPWEEITIGFQARFYRDPDIYQFDFWNHFQNNLPTNPPQWASGASSHE